MAQQRGIGHRALTLTALVVYDVVHGYCLINAGHVRRVLRLGRFQGCNSGHAPVLEVASQHLIEEDGLPAESNPDRPSRCEFDTAEVGEFGE